ncbi:hypothetical protein HET73_02450 [Wolbachia endosymbiont of Atemnus politus]|uniref:hypothetical protein n=1 Tax=Wolbachia endosymbiont of Atemnus politus TaxID=2682840 RepID=UPI001573FCE3|nr:hypothetical protein [Wolbachia endosymbiont of Atemnus politus]NSM56436.1 hypothetical protein [Wolbachia endosymbiont of Atemnus politus]NSX83210.1 hypothetical protein [Wolbachia endosymbiont of Atemnus politus]
MTKNISIVSKNLISIELVNKQDLENFIKIFTVLDKHIAAKTLFAEEVRIEYKQHDSIEVVDLLKSSGFTYHDVENVLHHLNKHGMKVSSSVTACALFSAYNNALESKDVAFSLFEGSPQFNIRINKNAFIIIPMSEENLELDSQNSRMFIELLKSEKSMYDCIVKENTINVVVHSEMHQAINSIIKSLIKSCLLAQEEEVKLKERLRQLAFKDQAFVEYSSIKTINRYPHNHPLRKYEGITKGIENILCNFITNENSESAIEQLNRLSLEISPDTPRIITKTIDKLVKFH